MSSASALLSWPDLRSTPDRRSPVSCFSASDRVSVPDRRSFEARLSSPDRFPSLPIVISVGLPRIMLDRTNYGTQCNRDLRQSLQASYCIAPKAKTRGEGRSAVLVPVLPSGQTASVQSDQLQALSDLKYICDQPGPHRPGFFVPSDAASFARTGFRHEVWLSTIRSNWRPSTRRVLAGSARCIVGDSVARRATEDLFIPIKVRPDIGAAIATRLGLQIQARPNIP